MAAPIAPSKLQALQETITTFLLDPRNHDLLTILKGLRNGLVYGTKVRFPHALVMVLLFRTGTLRSKATQILTATRTHATNLGLFVTLYKTTMLALRHLSPTGKERSADSFVAGALGGYVVFGRGGSGNSVNMQIVVYVFARVVLALAKLAVSDGPLWYPEAVQASMRSSMVYLYDNAETWTGIRDFLIHNK
ncbi:uncharacterized protein LAJ45_10865 [Morchella importuna]|uniref:uncharacterized protein n=1 Tax=Morchella importuna TaxID=1174673 RepID=UPI001E8CE324|nr:uncharacterized protein LAJ45_10865 [Morchella importuna]KAH8145085.1 hypothetical protein LAJ45_10865 [Morchella importuna]